MIVPVRLQLSRRAGFDLQALSRATNGLPALSVARPQALGNPFAVARMPDMRWCVYDSRLQGRTLAVCDDRRAAQREAVAFFGVFILDPAQAELRELGRALIAGRPANVACWCGPGEPCHGDTWLTVVRT